MRAVNADPSLVKKLFNFTQGQLLSDAEANDPYYLPPPPVPKLIRAALQVTNPSQLTLDQRWLLDNSFSNCTLLHYACAGDQLGVARYLLEKGADRGALNSAGQEGDHYTFDDTLREYLWTCPSSAETNSSSSGGVKKNRAAHRSSIFHSSHSESAASSVQNEVSPEHIDSTPFKQQPPAPPPPHRPSMSAASSLFAASEPLQQPAPSPASRPTNHRSPPPPPPPSGPPQPNAARNSSAAPGIPKALLPPSVGPTRKSSISQLIERTRKSINAAAEAAEEEGRPQGDDPRLSSQVRGSLASVSGDRRSFNTRRLSRVMQSRRHHSRAGEEATRGVSSETDDYADLPMMEMPAAAPVQPLVMRKLSVVAGSKLRDESFLVGEAGGESEFKQQLLLSDGEAESGARHPSPHRHDLLKSESKSTATSKPMSDLDISLLELDDSVGCLEAWEVRAANKTGTDAISVITATLRDESSLQGAKETAKLFARAKAIEREEARQLKKRQSVLRIYQKMPPIEEVASNLLRQHVSADSRKPAVSADAKTTLLEKYDRAVRRDESPQPGDDAPEWSPPRESAKQQKPKVDLLKLTFREMIWCKAGMGMNISEQSSDSDAKSGDVTKLRVNAYKQGMGLLRKEFKSYAFRDEWEALRLLDLQTSATVPVAATLLPPTSSSSHLDKHTPAVFPGSSASSEEQLVAAAAATYRKSSLGATTLTIDTQDVEEVDEEVAAILNKLTEQQQEEQQEQEEQGHPPTSIGWESPIEAPQPVQPQIAATPVGFGVARALPPRDTASDSDSDEGDW